MTSAQSTQGFITATFGRRYQVGLGATLAAALRSGAPIDCVARGKKREAACGDQVELTLTGQGTAVIEAIVPRTSLVWRADAYKQKMLAANVTQMALILAGKPSFSDELLTRALCAAEAASIKAIIVLNKCDLEADTALAQRQLAPYAALGYEIVPLAATQSVARLLAHLKGHTTLLLGQSGMGKSTIVNTLVPSAAAHTREISEALDSGTHTTTSARAYVVDGIEQACVIDTPGFQEFGLSFLDRPALDQSFREIAPLANQCRFSDCKHGPEPGCAVRAAVDTGSMTARRHALHQRIAHEIDYARAVHHR